MKRKLTSVFLLVAISVAALTSFVSCKDYEDDLLLEQDYNYAKLDEGIKALKDSLGQEVTNLKEALQKCKDNCAAEHDSLRQLLNKYYKLDKYSQDEVDSLLALIKEKLGVIADGETVASLIQNALDKAEAAQLSADSAQAAADTAKAAADAAKAAADSAQATANSANANAQQAQAAADSAKTAADNAQAAADSALDALDSLRQDVVAAQNAANQAKTAADSAAAKADAAAAKADSADSTAQAAAQKAQEVADQLATVDSALNARIDALDFATHAEVDSVEAKADSAQAAADAAQRAVDALAEEVDTALAELRARDNDQSDSILTLYNELDSLRDDIQEAQDSANAAKEVADSAKTLAEEIRDTLNNYIAATNPRIDALEDSVAQLPTLKEAISQLQEKYDSLDTKVDGLKAKVDSLDSLVKTVFNRLETVESKVAELTDRLNNLVTSIEIQQAFNPLFGSINLPFGFNSSLLTTYFGKVSYLGAEFPTADPTYFWNGVNNVTDEDVAVFKGTQLSYSDGETLFLEKDGNAGYLFFTVNPSQAQVKPDGFQLVNSRGEAAPFKLSNVAPSNDLLTFGWSTARATSANGLWRANVTIDNNFAKATPNLNINSDDLKDAYKALTKGAGSRSISGLAQGVIKAAAEVAPVATASIPAYGVQYAWQDNGVTNTTTSRYAIGAVAVHPLSYAFAKDVKFNSVPGITQLENAVDRITTTVKSSLANALPDDFFKFINPNLSVEKMIFNTAVLQEIDFTDTRNQISVNFKLNLTIPVDEVIRGVEVPISGLNGTVHIDKQTANVTIPADKISNLAITIPAGDFDEEEHVYNIETTDGVTGTAVIPEQDAEFDVNDKTVNVDIHLNTSFTVNDLDVSDQMEQQVLNIYDSLTGALAPVNDMMRNLRGYIDNINMLVRSVNDVSTKIEDIIDGRIDQLQARLVSYLDKFNNQFAAYLTPNDYLQPILLGFDGSLVRFSTTSPTNPTTLRKGNITLIPTTRTGEVISPAVKKWIAVTDVFKDGKSAKVDGGALATARDKANKGDINTILDGNQRKVALSLESGYVYEITYQALDYSGIVAAKKYYVKVK